MGICAVATCFTNSEKPESAGISLHAFPKDNKLKKKWIQFCKRKDKFNPTHVRICSNHFQKDDFENNTAFELGFALGRRLKPGRVPSIHSKVDNMKQLVSSRTARKNAKESKELIDALLRNDENEDNIKVAIAPFLYIECKASPSFLHNECEANHSNPHIECEASPSILNIKCEPSPSILHKCEASPSVLHIECEARLKSVHEELEALKSHLAKVERENYKLRLDIHNTTMHMENLKSQLHTKRKRK